MIRLIIALCALVLHGPVGAQEAYPNKPVRIVVGYAAGGGNDIIVRVMQPELQKGLGQPVVRERFGPMGLDPVSGSSEELGRQVARDIEKWTAVAKAANIKND